MQAVKVLKAPAAEVKEDFQRERAITWRERRCILTWTVREETTGMPATHAPYMLMLIAGIQGALEWNGGKGVERACS